LHFKVIDGGRIEIKCNHRTCTEGDTVVALHRYSLPDCEYLETILLKDPFARGRGARKHRKEAP
jgi:hypothetical protein